MTLKILRKIFLCALIIFLARSSFAADFSPDTATLSANRMRFDAQTGDFLADGDVHITAGELYVVAPVGSGNINAKEVNFDEGITASGKWQGDNLNLKAGKLLLSFADVPTCKFQNVVRGSLGTIKLDADRLTMIGVGGITEATPADRQTKFYLVKVRNLEDSSQGISFGAENVEGVMRGGELQEMTAKNNVHLKGRPKSQGSPVNIRGDNALYSLARGSVVLNGHVVAVQGGRTLRSNSVVYFPEQNRVEALGGVSRSSKGVASADRATITIDLSRERNISLPTKKETPAQNTATQKKTKTSTSTKTRKTTTKK